MLIAVETSRRQTRALERSLRRASGVKGCGAVDPQFIFNRLTPSGADREQTGRGGSCASARGIPAHTLRLGSKSRISLDESSRWQSLLAIEQGGWGAD